MKLVAKAVIFDMNGVIINDERIHQESWRRFCKKYGFKIKEKEFKQKVFGRTEKETLEYLFKSDIDEKNLSKYSNERVDIAIKLISDKLRLIVGLKDFFEYLDNRNVPMALATSSRRKYMNFILDSLKITKYFNVIVTAQDIDKGKPDPEIFLKAAKLLGVNPTDCLVIEDSISGIKAGKAASMKVVAITTTHKSEELILADKVISDFTKLSSQTHFVR